MLLLSLPSKEFRESAACSKVPGWVPRLRMMLLVGVGCCHAACWAVVRALMSSGCRAKPLRKVLLPDGGARVRRLGWVERGGSTAVVVAVAAGLVVVDMLEGSESVVEDMSERRRVHVDVSSEVADEPFLLDSRMMAGQSERKSVAGVPS